MSTHHGGSDGAPAPRQSPLGVLAGFVLLAGFAVATFGVVALDWNTGQGELLILIGVVVLLLGMAGLGTYIVSVRPRR